jgi:hypothetical protein
MAAEASAADLLIAVHGRILRMACEATGTHFSGLQVMGRLLKLPGSLAKRLARLDATTSYLRHATRPSCENLFLEVQQALADRGGSKDCGDLKDLLLDDDCSEEVVGEAVADNLADQLAYLEVKLAHIYESVDTEGSGSTIAYDNEVFDIHGNVVSVTRSSCDIRMTLMASPSVSCGGQSRILDEAGSCSGMTVDSVGLPVGISCTDDGGSFGLDGSCFGGSSRMSGSSPLDVGKVVVPRLEVANGHDVLRDDTVASRSTWTRSGGRYTKQGLPLTPDVSLSDVVFAEARRASAATDVYDSAVPGAAHTTHTTATGAARESQVASLGLVRGWHDITERLLLVGACRAKSPFWCINHCGALIRASSASFVFTEDFTIDELACDLCVKEADCWLACPHCKFGGCRQCLVYTASFLSD